MFLNLHFKIYDLPSLLLLKYQALNYEIFHTIPFHTLEKFSSWKFSSEQNVIFFQFLNPFHTLYVLVYYNSKILDTVSRYLFHIFFSYYITSCSFLSFIQYLYLFHFLFLAFNIVNSCFILFEENIWGSINWELR